jgi:tetratricopeptide (TPR) repeat protein
MGSPEEKTFIELAGCLVRAAPKEKKKMKRNLSLWLGLLALAVLPALGQAPTGKIHGHVTNPTGAPTTSGTVSLSTDEGKSSKFTFQVNAAGEYTGEATPGSYTVVYRAPETPADKMVDRFDGVKVVAGEDVVQDIDMSRKEFIDNLTPEQKKNLEELKKHNSEAMKANEIIKGLNADIKISAQDFHDADIARATAIQTLGAGASKADIEAKADEIKTAKYTEVKDLMLKDTGAKPDASVLWAQLAQAQVGLKEYDDAETTYQKVLALEAASKKPNPSTQGAANAGLGEIYARAGKVPEANAAYDAAAKINPPQAGFYLRNETIVFSQMNNADAQVAAADEAIGVDPPQPILYYLKGQGLIQKSTVDAKSGKIVPPAGCLEAYQKYLELAPTGPFAGEIKGILAGFDQKIDTSYKAPKPAKK